MDNPPDEADRAIPYCTLRLAGRLFGFDLRAVKEVTAPTAITPVPHAPVEVLGYMNLRGHIILALDLRRLMGMEPAPVSADSRLVLFKAAVGQSFGVLVDQVGDIAHVGADCAETRRVEEDSPADADSPWQRAAGLIAGVGKLDGELLVLVDPHRLLPVVAEVMKG